MNLKEIEYIVKIAEERNVTRAAEKLFITPSALNQQLLQLKDCNFWFLLHSIVH